MAGGTRSEHAALTIPSDRFNNRGGDVLEPGTQFAEATRVGLFMTRMLVSLVALVACAPSIARPVEPAPEPEVAPTTTVAQTQVDPSCRVPAGVSVEPIAGRYVDRVGPGMRRAVTVALPFSGVLTPEPHVGAVMLRTNSDAEAPAPTELSQCYAGWLDVITLEGDVPQQFCVTLTLASEGPFPAIDVLHSRGIPSAAAGCVDGECTTSLCVSVRDRTDARVVISGMVRRDQTEEPYLLRIE